MRFLWLIAILLLLGCEAQATPIGSLGSSTPPVDTPAISTSEPSSPSTQSLRYGVLTNDIAFLPDMSDIADIATIETISSDMPLENYDVVVTYGLVSGWQQSPSPHTLSLVINPGLAPLTDTVLADVVRSSLDAQVLVDSFTLQGAQSLAVTPAIPAIDNRTRLANAGYPDGVVLVLAAQPNPTVDIIQTQLRDSAIDVQVIASDDATDIMQSHLALVLWSNRNELAEWSALVGEDNILDLWSVPLSYLADESLTIEFTENGLPIPAR